MKYPLIPLSKLCIIEKGKTGIQKAIPGDYPLVVTSEARLSHNEFQFDDEAVIIPLVSSTGHGHASIKRIHFQKGKFALGSILCVVISKDKNQLLSEYLYYYLKSNKDRLLVSLMKGMANVTLPIKSLANLEIPLPLVSEQRNFIVKAKTLETYSFRLDTEITIQKDLITKIKQSILQDAVQGELISISNFKIYKIDDLLIDKHGLRTGPFGSSLNKSEHKDKGIPVWGIESISKSGQFTNRNKIFIEEIKYKELSTFTVKPEDVVISRSGTVGELCVLPPSIPKSIISTNLMKISLNKQIIDPYYFCFLFKGSKRIINQLQQLCGGTNRLFLTQRILKALNFEIPPLQEQKRIVKKVKILFAQIDKLSSENKKQQKLLEQLNYSFVS